MAFWKWWTITVLVSASYIIVHSTTGLGNYIIDYDPTRISLVIIAILVGCTLVVGYYTYLIQFKKTKITESGLQPLWYFSEGVLSLGMVGTLIGFMMVLGSSFQEVDTASTEEMKKLLGQLSEGIGVALITTLVGLISAILLKLQLVVMEGDNRLLEKKVRMERITLNEEI